MSAKIAKAKILEKDLIELEFTEEEVTLTEEEVSYGWSLATKIDPNKKSKVYLKTARWSLLDKEARNFVIKEIKTWPRVAILVHNLGQRLMGNFAVNLTGKSKNIKIFDKDSEALDWLKEN